MSQESSVEDILASIKKIIVEDQPVGVPAAGPEPARGPEPHADDVLELTRPVQAPPPRPAPSAPAPQPATAMPMVAAPLVSAGTAEASRQALAYLSSLRLKGAEPADDSLSSLVREMLRPMLKAWLDAELPGIVERLVVQEIARLTAQRD